MDEMNCAWSLKISLLLQKKKKKCKNLFQKNLIFEFKFSRIILHININNVLILIGL